MASAPESMPFPRGTRPTDRNFPKSIFLMNSGARDYSKKSCRRSRNESECLHYGKPLRRPRKMPENGSAGAGEVINQDQLFRSPSPSAFSSRKRVALLETSLPIRKPPLSAGISNPNRQATCEMPLKVSPDVTNVGVFHLTKLSNHRASFRRKAREFHFLHPRNSLSPPHLTIGA